MEGFEEPPPFEPPGDEVADTAPPRIGDVWCRKEYASVGSPFVGRVDVTDVIEIAGKVRITYRPRYGKNVNQSLHAPLEAFVKDYVPRARA